MKFVCAISMGAAALALVSTPVALGQEDQYVVIYGQIEQADDMLKAGQSDRAREKYLEAEAGLKKLQTGYPAWNSRTVQFRMDYVQRKLATLPKGAPETKPDVKPPATPGKPRVPGMSAQQEQVALLQQQVAQLQAEKALLQGKLQEALQAQPAAVDPRQLEEAQTRVRQLEKEKDLLRVELEKAEAKDAPKGDAAALEAAQKELEETKTKLGQSVASIAALTQDKQGLEAEKARLQAELAKPAAAGTPGGDVQKRLEVLEAEKKAWEKERQELQNKAASQTAAPADNGALLKAQKERDELLAKLNTANKELFEAKSRPAGADENLQRELTTLRAKVEAFEAKKVPYTPEELALFKPTQLQAAPEPVAVKKAPKPLPAGAGPVLSEAQRLFAAKRYADAEKKYLEVLKMDENHPVTLANLAAIQLEQEKFSDAEANLKKALSAEPDDAYALSLTGILNFRQEKYDQALEYLSRAAQIDPKNPETQNYLGITLSQKGQREASEAALRKAVQLAPEYAGAHHNLAVVYATQQPPFIELAKYHYQKALRAGHPSNADLEKTLNQSAK